MKIVVLDGFTLNPGDNPWSDLENLGEVVVFDRTLPDQLISRAAEADVLVINKIQLPADGLEQLPNLKYVTVTATGFDCVDAVAARAREISVSNVPIYGTDSVAQYVMAMLLHICHRIDLHDAAVREGEWAKRGDFSFWKTSLVELAGKTMGIIGFGRIGRRVGELANAFGMRVIACSRTQTSPPSYQPFAWSELSSLAPSADVISLNCPLNDQTAGLVNTDFLSKVKPSTILINASRGGLVVEADLAVALNEGRLAAAGVDVASAEPIEAANPLLTAKNCFITPHNAWGTLEARRRLMQTTVDNVRAFLEGQPIHVVN